MSTRQLRRLQNAVQQVNLDEDSGDDFQPLYTGQHNHFDLLSTNTDATKEAQQSPARSSAEEVSSLDEAEKSNRKDPENKKKKKRKSRKQKNRKAKTTTALPENEVDRAVAEVNSILGEPGTSAQVSAEAATDIQDITAPGKGYLEVNPKLLDSNSEFIKRFGQDIEETRKHNRPNVHQQLRRRITLQRDNYRFSVKGISMEEITVKDGIKYFKFTHSVHYAFHVHTLLKVLKERRELVAGPTILPETTIEAVLQNIDTYFLMEETSAAIKAIESAICFLQDLFCPGFNYVDAKTRLEYIHVENRPFHILLLKYVYILTTRACHKTALEITKLMLSLDPSDPLGVFLIMDTLALRARSHQWLKDIFYYFVKTRDGDRAFHLVYSAALAMYEVYKQTKDPENLREAQATLMLGMTQYPGIVPMLIQVNSLKRPDITEHAHFKPDDDVYGSPEIKRLQHLYTKFVGPKWREGDNMKWLCAEAEKLKNDYDTISIVQTKCKMATYIRYRVMKIYPVEIKRHLFGLKHMSSWVLDYQIGSTVADTYPFNPYPSQEDDVDIHGYYNAPWSDSGYQDMFFED